MALSVKKFKNLKNIANLKLIKINSITNLKLKNKQRGDYANQTRTT